ncbi:MAG TPA: sensor domain-containing diguanylate cyclase [Longimicrobium sp.]|nr:sensor domain-containing diguanylate cyclase [Longimicrobium sp.]
MIRRTPSSDPTSGQLLAIIRIQTEIAKLGLDLEGVMALVAREAQVITGSSGAVVELAEDDDMVYRAVSGIAANQLGLRLKRATSLSGLSVAMGTPLCCDDSECDDRVDREACRRVGLRSMVVVPLNHDDAAVGVLKVLSERPMAFGDADVQVLQLMSELIGAAMYHATRYGADELFRSATHDNLTGIANRALFFDRLRHCLAQARRAEQRLGVLVLDMDGLKRINDAHGHRAGDAALREIASRLSQGVRQADTVARLGGDEFGVVLSPVDDREGAWVAASRLAARLERPLFFNRKRLALVSSVGVAVFPDDGDQPDALVESADQAMYAIKRQRSRTRERAVQASAAGD